jgi:hypothetical protein
VTNPTMATVVVRARRTQRKGDDSVVKLRPVVPDKLPRELRKWASFGVEVDAMPGGFVCSGSRLTRLLAGLPTSRDEVCRHRSARGDDWEIVAGHPSGLKRAISRATRAAR